MPFLSTHLSEDFIRQIPGIYGRAMIFSQPERQNSREKLKLIVGGSSRMLIR